VNYRQAIKYVERVNKAAKKSKACGPLMSAFELILKKMKNQKELTQSDYLPTELCEVLWTEVQAIDAKNEEISDSELWNTDSLCFRYFNLLQEFKTTKSVSTHTCYRIVSDLLNYCFRLGSTGTTLSLNTEL